jgi:hypothetical protein
MDILDELQALVAALDNRGIEYALCGGLAMAIYALPRATLDIDLLIEADSLDAARQAAHARGFTIEAAPMAFHGGQVPMCRVSKIEPGTGELLILDLLMVTPTTASAWDSRVTVEWEGGRMTVVSPEGLILLKSLRGSGQDLDDIAHLKGIDDEG